jgi:pyruvate/oxaloacetate carboxyltransferase
MTTTNRTAIVMCRVSGGMTGTREAMLKENGQTRYFESLEDAQKVAADLNAKMNGDKYRTADFRYWAEEY